MVTPSITIIIDNIVLWYCFFRGSGGSDCRSKKRIRTQTVMIIRLARQRTASPIHREVTTARGCKARRGIHQHCERFIKTVGGKYTAVSKYNRCGGVSGGGRRNRKTRFNGISFSLDSFAFIYLPI